MKLYVYDHCPFCVKTCMIFGYKKLSFDLVYLLNDDEHTPLSMTGVKSLPILAYDDGSYLGESLDIISLVDNIGNKVLSAEPVDEHLNLWMNDISAYVYPPAMPRWIKAGYKEFSTESAANYFISKKESFMGPFSEILKNTDSYINQIDSYLNKLNLLLPDTGDYFLNNKASMNDIHLYPILRAITIIKGITFPVNVFRYMKKQASLTGINLNVNIAI